MYRDEEKKTSYIYGELRLQCNAPKRIWMVYRRPIQSIVKMKINWIYVVCRELSPVTLRHTISVAGIMRTYICVYVSIEMLCSCGNFQRL